MKQLITFENYEAFYLDYLEGNLGNEETIAFKAFLAAHQELILDDESLVEIPTDTSMSMTAFEKELLKKSDENAIVSSENAEYYLISELEGEISSTQQEQLNSVVANSLELQTERKLYAKTILPLETIVYGNKSALSHEQKGRIIPFWMIGSSVAAASIALFILFRAPQVGTNTTGNQTEIAKHKKEKINVPQSKDFNNQLNNSTEIQVIQNTNSNPQNKVVKNNRWPSEELFQKEMENGAPQPEFALIETEIRKIETPKENNKLPNNFPLISPNSEGNGIAFNQIKNNGTPNVDLAAQNGLTGLYSPIPMITKTMSERLNTTIEFKKNRDKTKKGFFLKIGKLVIDRTK